MYQVVNFDNGITCTAFASFSDAQREALALHQTYGTTFVVQRGDEIVWCSRNGHTFA